MLNQKYFLSVHHTNTNTLPCKIKPTLILFNGSTISFKIQQHLIVLPKKDQTFHT